MFSCPSCLNSVVLPRSIAIGAALGLAALEFDELLFDAAGALGVLAALEFAGGAALGGDAFAGALELVGEELLRVHFADGADDRACER